MASIRRKQGSGTKKSIGVREAPMLYTEPSKSGARGKPVKIAADFDTALDALVAVPSKKRRKAGRP